MSLNVQINVIPWPWMAFTATQRILKKQKNFLLIIMDASGVDASPAKSHNFNGVT